MDNIQKIIDELLEKHLDGDFKVFACWENPPTASLIQKFEDTIGARLPEDFYEFLKSKFGNLYVEVKEEIWQRPKAYDVGEFWSFLYGIVIYGFSEDFPQWTNIKFKTAEFQLETGSDYIPFLKVIGDVNVYCFDKNGKIFRWNHELGEFKRVEKSFVEVLEYELSELRKRKDKKKSK